MTRKSAVAAMFACVAAIACSSGHRGDGEGYLGGEAGVVECTVKLPTRACPGQAPSYAKDVAPILAAHCTGCHNPQGEYPAVRLDSYAEVTNRMHISTALALLGACQMPPPPLPPVTSDEAETLYCWITSCLSGRCVK